MPLEALSKDDPDHGQMPQKTNVHLKLHRTNESFFYWTFETVEEADLEGELFLTGTEKQAQKQKTSSTKTMSTLAQQLNVPQDGASVSGDANQKATQKDLVIVLYNDSVLSNFLSSAVTVSVVGVYVTVVYAVGRFLRLIFDRYSQRILYEELPETEKLFDICEGIFIAQLKCDMVTEKRLYDLLIMVYRSPDLMIRMTGYQQRYADDDAC